MRKHNYSFLTLKPQELRFDYEAIENARDEQNQSSDILFFSKNIFVVFLKPSNIEKKMSEIGIKLHISVDYRDLSKAWNIIYPILLLKENSLRSTKIALQKHSKKFRDYKNQKRQLLCRYFLGAQITIPLFCQGGRHRYLKDSTCQKAVHQEYWQLITEITKRLNQEEIRKGVRPDSDIPLNEFFSGRFDGGRKKYISVSALKTKGGFKQFLHEISKHLPSSKSHLLTAFKKTLTQNERKEFSKAQNHEQLRDKLYMRIWQFQHKKMNELHFFQYFFNQLNIHRPSFCR